MKHVVIAGGGFAGVRLARKLRKHKDIHVSLINSSPDFRYYPAMYRAATGFKMGSARLPLEWMLLDAPRANLIIDEVSGLDPQQKVITTVSGQAYTYDYAVFSLGSVTTYFNIEGIHEHSFGMKTPDEIIRLRAHLHEKVTSNAEADENYVIVGAGPTGVELAGGLGAHVKRIAKRHRMSRHHVKVWLVEAGPRILPQISERAARKVQHRLEKLGVTILTGTTVTRETVHTLNTSHGTIRSHTVIWTAGTANNPFFSQHPQNFELNKRGRVVVNKHLQTHDGVYVIGDNAATPHSGLAYTAVHHGNFVARDIAARMRGSKRPKKFESEPIVVIPVDNNWSVLQYRKFHIAGRLVSLVRRAADYIGYMDILGPIKAFTIWSNTEHTENSCQICDKNS